MINIARFDRKPTARRRKKYPLSSVTVLQILSQKKTKTFLRTGYHCSPFFFILVVSSTASSMATLSSDASNGNGVTRPIMVRWAIIFSSSSTTSQQPKLFSPPQTSRWRFSSKSNLLIHSLGRFSSRNDDVKEDWCNSPEHSEPTAGEEEDVHSLARLLKSNRSILSLMQWDNGLADCKSGEEWIVFVSSVDLEENDWLVGREWLWGCTRSTGIDRRSDVFESWRDDAARGKWEFVSRADRPSGREDGGRWYGTGSEWWFFWASSFSEVEAFGSSKGLNILESSECFGFFSKWLWDNLLLVNFEGDMAPDEYLCLL